jgi:hypothetical protein
MARASLRTYSDRNQSASAWPERLNDRDDPAVVVRDFNELRA